MEFKPINNEREQLVGIMTNQSTIDIGSLEKLQEHKHSLMRVATPSYGEELRAVMNTGIYTCYEGTLIREAVNEMALRNISSVVVVNQGDYPVGIVTERDVLQRIAAEKKVDIDKNCIEEVMTRNPVVLSPEDTVYRALSLLISHRIKHLVIVENGQAKGMITLWWLLKLKYPEPLELIEEIQHASSANDLKALRDKLPAVVESKLSIGVRAYDIIVMTSMINQDIHRKVMDMAIHEFGEPPVPFCLYVTGSHGRLESLLATDQDHGMIIADNDQQLQYDPYFVNLSIFFSNTLHKIGYENCPGYIMSNNPLWRKSLSEWKQQLQYWFESHVPQVGRFSTVLFDAAPIYGERRLFTEMMHYAFSLFDQHHEVARTLYEEEKSHKSPIGIFGRFITETEVS